MICWLNGELMPQEQARVPVSDRGFLYGDAVFETVRVAHGRPLWLSRHLARLTQGARLLAIELPLRPQALVDVALSLIAAAELHEGVLRITLSRGPGQRGPLPVGEQHPTLLMTLGKLPPHVAERARRGIVLATSRWTRPAPTGLPNTIKHANYLCSILAMQEVAALGADEALLLSAAGHLAEGATSNLFLARSGTLVTPDLDSGALAGTTRAWVIEQAQAADAPVQQRPVTPAELACADEVFMTNAVSGIVPVARIDGRPYAAPGPVTSGWMQAWARAAAEPSA